MIRLGDLFDFKNGRCFKKTEWKQTGLPIIRIQNLNNEDAPFNYFDDEYDSSIEVNPDDLLFSWSGTVGSSFGPHIWNREKAVLNQHIFKLTFKKEMEKRYAFYSLLFITAEIERSVVGAVGLVHVTKKSLNEFQIPLPPIPEQQRIVTILDQAFADIEKARANAEKNLKNARELFDSYLNQVFSHHGEGNQVAMAYSKARLIDCCEIKPPKSEARELLNPAELVSFVPMASLGKYRKGLILDKDKKLADVSGSYTYFAENDVLLAKITPCFENGKLGIATGLTNGIGFGSSEFIVFRPNDSLNSEYLYHFLNRASLRAQGQLVMTGAVGHKRVPKEFIENLTIPLPPISEQKDRVNILGELSVEIEALESVYQTKLKSLEELKKSLLQKAFSGELTKTEDMVA